MLFLSKITILHILYCFGDHTTKKNSSHETSHTSANAIPWIFDQDIQFYNPIFLSVLKKVRLHGEK